MLITLRTIPFTNKFWSGTNFRKKANKSPSRATRRNKWTGLWQNNNSKNMALTRCLKAAPSSQLVPNSKVNDSLISCKGQLWTGLELSTNWQKFYKKAWQREWSIINAYIPSNSPMMPPIFTTTSPRLRQRQNKKKLKSPVSLCLWMKLWKASMSQMEFCTLRVVSPKSRTLAIASGSYARTLTKLKAIWVLGMYWFDLQ